jgi:toxin YhaV
MSPLWKVYYFEVFYLQYTKLIADVFEQKKKDPEGYKFHEKTKLLARVRSVIRDQISNDPGSSDFHLGSYLPKDYRCYKRAKSGLPDRYRLFFRYRSDDSKIIIIWMNSELTLRKNSDKNDVYNVFLKMLKNKRVPPNWNTLVKKAKLPPDFKKTQTL